MAAGLGGEAGQQSADVGGVDAAAGQSAEHRRAGTGAEPSATIQPPREQRCGLLVEADGAAAVALAMADPQRPGRQVDVAQLERQGLGDAQPGAPQHGNQRPIANPG